MKFPLGAVRYLEETAKGFMPFRINFHTLAYVIVIRNPSNVMSSNFHKKDTPPYSKQGLYTVFLGKVFKKELDMLFFNLINKDK